MTYLSYPDWLHCDHRHAKPFSGEFAEVSINCEDPEKAELAGACCIIPAARIYLGALPHKRQPMKNIGFSTSPDERLLQQVSSLADSEGTALGFLPKKVYAEAVERERLLCLVSGSTLMGYVLFGGSKGLARIFQVAVAPDYRRAGYARKLLRTAISKIEQQRYSAVQARVAADLRSAQKLYESLDFSQLRVEPGGKTTGRTILIYMLELELSKMQDELFLHSGDIDAPLSLYVLDLNVLFDYIRERDNKEYATGIIAGCLKQNIRLAVAQEFIRKLEKNNLGIDDSKLPVAQRLLVLPQVCDEKLSETASKIHELVFGGMGTDKTASDARHIAHACLAGARGFITGDKTTLQKHHSLFNNFNIEVLSTLDAYSLFHAGLELNTAGEEHGENFSIDRISKEKGCGYLSSQKGISAKTVSELNDFWAVSADSEIVAVGGIGISQKIPPKIFLLIHCNQENLKAGVYTNYLMNKLIYESCKNHPAHVQLSYIPGQVSVRMEARNFGFQEKEGRLEKIALGCPLLAKNWEQSARLLRGLTRLSLPEQVPDSFDDPVLITSPSGQQKSVSITQLEKILSPCLIACPHRPAVIMPIQKRYSDLLFDAGKQQAFDFFAKKPVKFLAERSYISSPRNRSKIIPKGVALFYESSSSNGAGAIIAVAAITNVVVKKNTEVNHEQVVVDDVSSVSNINEVLQTSFDNILLFPHQISLEELRGFAPEAVKANLVTATEIASDTMIKIISHGGWQYE